MGAPVETVTTPPAVGVKRKAFLALPTYANSMRKDFVLSLMQLLWINPIPDIEWTIGTIGGDGIARARNNLAQSFLLTTDCELFITIDVDIIFTRDHIARIVAALCPEKPVIGGLYAAKQIAHRWIKTDLPNELPDPLTGLQKVQECGTGLKGYHRRYFEEVMNAFPEIQYFCDGSPDRLCKWDFFSMGVVNGRYLSEDYYADHRARLIGIDVYVDTLCEVKHEGFMAYPFPANWEIFNGKTVQQVADLASAMGGEPITHESPQVTKAA